MERFAVTFTGRDVFEDKSAALENALLDIDKLWCERTALELVRMAVPLEARVEPLCLELATFARGLAADFTLRGPLAACSPLTPWPHANPLDLPDQGVLDATILRAAGFGLLARAFERFSLEDAEDYRLEVVTAALLETASLREDADLGLRLEACRTVRQEVAQSPRRTGGERVTLVLRVGQDLADVAETFFGNRNATDQVIRAFDLEPPFLSPTPRSKCLHPGSRLELSRTVRPGATPDPFGETFELEALGVSGGGQEWDMVTAPGGGLEVVSGTVALATDLALRMATPLGSLSEEPRYGMLEVAGQPLSALGAAYFLIAAESLMEDGRLEKVEPAITSRPSPDGLLVGRVVAIPKRQGR